MPDTILIVDDSSFIVDGLVSILKKSYRPIAVYGGQQCLDALQKEIPSIIILDIIMEPMDGWETLARIKENPDTRHIPVLMFSAKKISAVEAEEHRIGIDDFISKPVTPKKLIEAIEKVLTRQKANHANIESWRSAGIGEDRIDRYISLMTSREVDMSLLQNMKVQHSLLHDDETKNRIDLEDVIAAIEARIHEEGLLEEKLFCEMQESVAKAAEVKERTRLLPAMNKSGLESLPADWEITEKAQPEFNELQGTSNGRITPSSTEVLFTEGSVPKNGDVPEIITIPEVHLPESRLAESGSIQKTTGSGSLFEKQNLIESSHEEPEIKAPAEPHVDKSGHESELFTPTLPTEIQKKDPATRICFSETPSEKCGNGVTDSSDEKVPHVAEQKYPVIHEPRPLRARTLDNKPAFTDAPIPRAIGSGTDTSSKESPYRVGRSNRNNRDAGKGTTVSEKDKTPFKEGIISRIISTIIRFFKRQEK